jgi:adenosylcobinamide kinase/adenosylcobinamide-phosphate guanylyltransferase
MALTLVLGGARSGKSAYARLAAEREAGVRGGRQVMIATAEALDEEMSIRIARHRAERDEAWITLEEPLNLAGAIERLDPADVAVVDCLTLWLSNLMHRDQPLGPAFDALEAAACATPAALFLVSNEVGQGLVPDNALARRFRDDAGRLHQRLARAADGVVFLIAGLAQVLKQPSPGIRRGATN